MCLKEMCSLKKHDSLNHIQLIDIHDIEKMDSYPHIDKNHALKVLHGIYRGQILLGLDVTVTAWKLVGKNRWLVITRLPVLKGVFDKIYLLFAKHRMKISALLFNAECANNSCSRNKP
jgi:predicted DCC family thiol-disulfide oxidoreductase YuxK